MVKIGSHLALNQAKLIRFSYGKFLPWIVNRDLYQTETISAKVYAFSCERDLPEQVVSIRSFIKHVGVPTQFIVVSDGTYTKQSEKLLQQVHRSVTVCHWRDLGTDRLLPHLDRYTSLHPLGKKLAVLVNLPVDETTIYADSDILFFPSAREILNIAENNNKFNYYCLDCQPSLDNRLLNHDHESFHPVNSGFMIFKERLDWTDALDRLARFEDRPTHHTEQTVVHLAMHQNNALPLCHSKYIVSAIDLFIYQDLFARDNVAIRHYVTTVRHKFWLSSVKSLLFT